MVRYESFGEDYLFECGIALPIVLVLSLLIATITSIMGNSSSYSLRSVKDSQAMADTNYVAEGALNDMLAQMSVNRSLWRKYPVLLTKPSGYTQYNPLTYTSNNGIPTCSGTACQRHLYPIGGGLLKNFGPIGGDGSEVDASYSITQQLDLVNPPDPDITLNGRNAWVQVERLDQVMPSENSIGATLLNNDPSGLNSYSIRFRVTAVSTRNVRGLVGTSTIVAVVEMPPQ